MLARVCTVFAAAAMLAAAAAPASATTVSFTGGALSITGDDADSYIYETSFDDPFETDFDPSTPVFAADKGTLEAGPGCDQVTPAVVTCLGLASGTRATITLGGGNDFFAWNQTGAAMTIDAGDGNDEILAGRGADVIRGGNGNDAIVGYGGNDTIDGGPGRDNLSGSNGADRIIGGSGRDTMTGDGAEEAAVTNRPVADRIEARDRERDTITCEGGRDKLIVDARDVINGCSGSAGSSSSGAASATATAGSLTLTVIRGRLPSIRSLRRGKPIPLKIEVSAPCTAVARLTLGAGEARRLRVRGSRTVARSARIVRPGRTVSVPLRAQSRLRRPLAGKRAATFTIAVSCNPGKGRIPAVRLTAKLRR